MGIYAPLVRSWLVADLAAPRKQRHTARRVWQRLVAEEGACVSESTVRAFVARTRRELVGPAAVMIPQNHLPGGEAEVDFGEFRAVVGGVMVKLCLFVMRLSYSGAAVHIAYPNEATESFLDGHVRAFDRLGGVPVRIRYDNLKAAVVRILLGRDRLENPRFIALRSHYGFDSFFCVPGIGGAHEKGGVEGEIGRFRRRHLTPPPVAGDLAALNQLLAAADTTDTSRVITGRVVTVAEALAEETPTLTRQPAEPFDPSMLLSARVDTKARICVRQSYYSVPARLAGRRVAVRLGAVDLTVYDGRTQVAAHPRGLGRGAEHLTLDHYLEVLHRKPGALAGATALATARASGTFTPTHQAFWDAARRGLGDGLGTRALIGVLLLHRTMPTAAIDAGMTAALAAGRPDPDLVAVEARRHLDTHTAPAPPLTAPPAPAGSVTPISAAAGFGRPTPSLAGYDTLLDNGAS
jgi:hypothetical protein